MRLSFEGLNFIGTAWTHIQPSCSLKLAQKRYRYFGNSLPVIISQHLREPYHRYRAWKVPNTTDSILLPLTKFTQPLNKGPFFVRDRRESFYSGTKGKHPREQCKCALRMLSFGAVGAQHHQLERLEPLVSHPDATEDHVLGKPIIGTTAYVSSSATLVPRFEAMICSLKPSVSVSRATVKSQVSASQSDREMSSEA